MLNSWSVTLLISLLSETMQHSSYSQLNHHKRDSHIIIGKISYSFIEPELLPSTPAYGHKVRALAFHPHPTFTEPLVGSAFKIRSEVGGGVFFEETVNVFRPLAVYAEELCR